LRGHQGAVRAVAFSPDDDRVVTGSVDRSVRVWSLDGVTSALVLRGHDDSVSAVAFSPDGSQVLSGAWDRTARLWNADGTGDALVLRGHEDIVTCVAFSLDGRKVVTGSRDKTARVWSIDVELLGDVLWNISRECLSGAERSALLSESSEEASSGAAECQSEIARRAKDRGQENAAIGATAERRP
jgi:WD40 repeat protein